MQTIHKPYTKRYFKKILRNFKKKYCKVFYNVILYSCSKERTTKIKKEKRGKQIMKWDCRGVKENIENIKNFLATSKEADKNFIAYKALKEQDRVITNLLTDKDNDERSLMSYRRQVRVLLRQLA